ncbi:STAS domain-containing protein [Embleya sp. NBC_00896]|uniref:STAS domain-containing protein n=1 Tax=Embleya sp. NBC_00896 TaxID=2975961 RepID=UPI00386CD0E3|nr:STAS domain-containing protein [Embleya sp. NBC_00896]
MVDPFESPTTRAAVLAVYVPLARADIPGLCERLRELLHDSSLDPFPCDLRAVTSPDLATIEALARLQLTARRLGRRIRLLGACGELCDLLTLTGLGEVLADVGPVVEGCRQAEQREQVRDVEERVEADDPTL